MKFLTFSWWDYILFFIMIGLSIAIGIYYGYFATPAEYFYGGRKIKIFPVAMSSMASGLTGIVLLGITAEVYMHGIQIWTTVFSAVIMGIMANFVYLPVFYKLKLKSTYEYFEMRFDKNVRRMASFLYVVLTVLELPILVYAPSLAFSQVSGFNLHLTAITMSLICVFYTSIGGFKAVIWTDTLQFTIALCSLFFVFIMGIISVGGFDYIWKTAELGDRTEIFNMNPDPTIRSSFWSISIGAITIWVSRYAINPAAVQRFVALPTYYDSKKLLLIIVLAAVITKTINCFLGLIIYAKYYDCDPFSAGQIKKPDQILSYYVLDVADQMPGLSGLFIASLFSVGLTALSTSLNTLSGTIYADFVVLFIKAETASIRRGIVMKLITVIMGAVTVILIFVVERLGTMIELAITLTGISTGALIGIFTMGMTLPFANAKGALYGGIGSLAFMTLYCIKVQMLVWNGMLKYQPKPLHTYGCNITLPAAVIVSNSTTSTSKNTAEEPFWLFRISFSYYGLIGTLITLIIGVPLSWITRNSNTTINPKLFSPFVHSFLPQTTKTTNYTSGDEALHVLNTNRNDQEN